MVKKLSKKQKGFCEDYLRTGNGTKAALKNYDLGSKGGKTDEKSIKRTAHSIAAENIQKPAIIQFLEDHAEVAADTMLELTKQRTNLAVALGAAKDILDRGGYKPVEKTQHSGEIKHTITGMKISRDGN